MPPTPAASAGPGAAAAPPPPAGALPTAAAAAAAGKRASSKLGPPSLQDRLQSDAMAAHAASFLPGAELCRLAVCASCWQGLLLGAGSRWLWQEALQHEENGPTLLRRLEHTAPPPPQPAAGKQRQQQQGPTTQALAAACGQAHRLSRLGRNSPVRWAEVPAGLAGTGGRWPVRAMEGHAATLLEDRWMVMVGGFGTRGVENEVYMLDTWALEAGEEGEAASAAWWRLAEQGQRPNPPVYGHVACALGPRRLAVFGGCTMGGYAGVTNDLYILDLELDKNGPLLKGGEKRGDGRPRLGGVVTWRRTQALGQSLTSRAYCTLTPLPDPSDGGVRRLLVLGGIREGRATLDMEVVEFKGDDEEDGTPMVEVVKPAADGPAPPVRMGHSCTLLPPSPESDKEARCRWRLVVLGGSDGSDLLRNGEERDDVWLLDVSLIDDDDDGDGGQSSTKGAARPRFAWSQPPLPRPAPWSFPMGRTHTAHYVGGGMILCFGGGAGLSNRLGLLDTNEWTFGAPRLLRSSRGSDQGHRTPLVRPRLSHVAVCAGTKLMVHGGWNGRELGDLLALDLVPPISSLPVPAAAAAAAAAAASGRRGSEDEEDEEEEEEDESEDEEEDEEEGGHGSRRRSPQPRIECAQS